MKGVRFFLLLTMIFWGVYAYGALTDHYRKGALKLQPEAEFGKEFDWSQHFYDSYKDVVIAKSGDIFVFNSRQHNFMKFNPEGMIIGTFGIQGEGPGDFYDPGCLSILDDKYLVIDEYPSRRRFNLFDLAGSFKKTIQTPTSCFKAIALKNNYIAYSWVKYIDPDHHHNQGFYKTIENITSKNIDTGKETLITSFNLDNRYIPLYQGSFSTGAFLGKIIFCQGIDGNLITGVSNTNRIIIYSPEGKEIKRITLNIQPLKVTKEYIDAYRTGTLENIQGKEYSNQLRNILKKKLRSQEFDNLFGDVLPYYRYIQVDGDGNILVFKYGYCVKECDLEFQVYSPNGDYICDSVIKGKDQEMTLGNDVYEIIFSEKFRLFQFIDDGFIGICRRVDEDSDTFRLVKAKFANQVLQGEVIPACPQKTKKNHKLTEVEGGCALWSNREWVKGLAAN